MKRPPRALPALLLAALALTGCAPGPIPGLGASAPAQGDTAPAQGNAGQNGGTPAAKEDEKPLHVCTWEGDGDVREDIRIFGTSDDEPFTKVELVQYLPTKVDLENGDPEDVKAYLASVKAKVDEQDDEKGIDPSTLTAGTDGKYVTLTYVCKSLEDLQKVHDFYYDASAGDVFDTAAHLTGVTTVDGEPVEKGDLKDFDSDMQAIRDWSEANREKGKAFTDGLLDSTSDEDAAASQEFVDSSRPISDIVLKWNRTVDALSAEQKATFEEVKSEFSKVLLGAD